MKNSEQNDYLPLPDADGFADSGPAEYRGILGAAAPERITHSRRILAGVVQPVPVQNLRVTLFPAGLVPAALAPAPAQPPAGDVDLENGFVF